MFLQRQTIVSTASGSDGRLKRIATLPAEQEYTGSLQRFMMSSMLLRFARSGCMQQAYTDRDSPLPTTVRHHTLSQVPHTGCRVIC